MDRTMTQESDGSRRSFKHSEGYKRYVSGGQSDIPTRLPDDHMPHPRYNTVCHDELNFCTLWFKC